MTRIQMIALGLGLPLVVAATAHAQTYQLSGRRVAVYNLVGSARVEHGTGSNVVVEVKRSGRDADRLQVKTGDIEGVPTLRVIFPADEIVSASIGRSSSTNMSVTDEGLFGRRGGRRVSIVGRDRAHRGALEADADLIIRVPDGMAVDIHQGVGDMSASGVNGDVKFNGSSGDITVDNTRGLIDANSASGSITITSTEGDVDLNSASGSIELDRVRARRVSVDVASGSITARGVTAETVDLNSASGSIRVSATNAPELKAESASGNVRVSLGGDVRRVDVSTASGSAEVTVPASFAGEVEMETASGDIDVDFEMSVLRQRRGYLRGKIGEGSARVTLSAASGNVRLLKR